MSDFVPVLIGLSLLVTAGILVRRLLMWMGDRGWIYYGDSPGSPGAGALAAMEIASMLEPEVEHVIEEIRSEKARAEGIEPGIGSPKTPPIELTGDPLLGGGD